MTVTGFFLRDDVFLDYVYIVAFSLFIIGLMFMTSPRTARRGNMVAAVGMAIAVADTLLRQGIHKWGLIILGLAIGTAVGIPAARSVKMTAMPQMVALFNGVGGGAVALIAWAEYRHFGGIFGNKHLIPVLFAAIIGSISFWGSNIAFGKLQELIPGRPIMLPGRWQTVLNAGLLTVCVVLAVILAAGTHSNLLFFLILVAAAILGNAIVLPIGGADMPVVISLLNAFTGLSAAAAGIALDNIAMIVAGMLVGASGSILTNLMAEAMNRSIPAIVAGGFGGGGAAIAAAEGAEERTARSTTADDVAIQLSYASRVVIVPGYGMAVAQAQHAVRELTKLLEKNGVDVAYAIHPVAGRMPGHMNVLLAEADVPYDQLKEMDDINPVFPQVDVALVIGANDVTNPAARDVPDSPIYGMPILDVDKAHNVIVLKRSMNTGFAGIDNPLFYKENTSMLFGDAKESIQHVTEEVKQL
ncbi:MAG TPA: NAD(P)(+) transhydrogenase (Re/Si-specific) subunit beta [Thermoleophilaceae bacterium]|jgi:NAD(P) transhydrogenase subunit beta